MLVKPSGNILQNIATRISEVRKGETKSCLDQPKIAARYLRTKEDLSMFYGEFHEAEAALAVIVAVKAVVAATAVITATLLAVNGPGAHSSTELESLVLDEVDTLDVNDLINARRNQLI